MKLLNHGKNSTDFSRMQRKWKIAAAGIILLITAGCTLKYQEDVKAALQRVTSWIGQALGIENGDTDSYTNVVGKKHLKRWNHHNIE